MKYSLGGQIEQLHKLFINFFNFVGDIRMMIRIFELESVHNCIE